MSSSGDVPHLTIADGRADIALGRPDKRNRIEPVDLAELMAHLDTIDADPSARVVVIAARGPVWCAGFHLGALAEGERPTVSFGEVCDRIEALRIPTIAAIGGSVHGGGTDLAMSCDFRIAGAGVELGMPAAKIGLQYYASGLRRFVERIGPSATKRLFLTAERISADELLRIGYLTDIVPAGKLDARVDELCAAVKGLAPLAVRNTKWAINELAGSAPDLAAVEAGAVASSRSNDHKEAMRAMKEKRPPTFTGT